MVIPALLPTTLEKINYYNQIYDIFIQKQKHALITHKQCDAKTSDVSDLY